MSRGDPTTIAFFQRHPAAMAAFDELAGRVGQSIEAAMSPKGFGFDDCVVVRYSATRDPLGVIHPDGQTEEV